MVMLETTDGGGFRDAGASSDSDSDMAGGTPAEAEDDLSPEDAAWVDSCLVEGDGDGGEGMGADRMSGDAWASLTEAFIDALAYSASGNATAIPEEEKVDESSSSMDTGREAPGENASSHELMSQANGSQMANGSFQADAALNEEEPSSPTASTYAATFYDQPSPTLGDSSDGAPSAAVAGGEFEATGEGCNSSSGSNGRLDAASVVLGNEFPEDHQVYGDGEDEFSIAEGGEEVGEVELTRDIFRVWELEVTEDEENKEDEEQFGWQLKKALEGSSVGAAVMPPSVAHDPSTAISEDEEWKMGAVLDDENLEQLIAGITDISLGRPSSDA